MQMLCRDHQLVRQVIPANTQVASTSASKSEQSSVEIATLQQEDPNLQPILAYLEKK